MTARLHIQDHGPPFIALNTPSKPWAITPASDWGCPGSEHKRRASDKTDKTLILFAEALRRASASDVWDSGLKLAGNKHHRRDTNHSCCSWNSCASRHEIMHKIEQPLGITWLLYFMLLFPQTNGGKHLKKLILLLIDANEPCIDI